MKRREFLTKSLAASSLALAGAAQAQSSAPGSRDYYELRTYHLRSGPQSKLINNYVADALIPALNRLGIAPVGALRPEFGPETSALYLILPSTDLATLVTANLKLVHDDEFMKTADSFWNAPISSPAFINVESSLLLAFEGYPKLTVPPATKQHAERIFELRTYESASNRDHVRKIEMMHDGEFDIFRRAGAAQVFFGDTLIGTRMPKLTYMLSFQDLPALTASWKAFFADPAWKKLAAEPRYSFESTVSNVSDLVLRPAPYSQI